MSIPDPDLLSERTKTLCVEDRCSRCGAMESVTVERIVEGDTMT